MCHGGSIAEYELIEMEDMSHWAFSYWNDEEPAQEPVGGPVAVSIDLVSSLARLRAQHRKLHCVDDHPQAGILDVHRSLRQPAQGKYRTLFIATPTDGDWLIRRSLILNEPTEWAWESIAAATVHGAIAARRKKADPLVG
jgi:hypothetical protein